MSTQADVHGTKGYSLFMYNTTVSANTEVLCIVAQPFIKPRVAFRSPSSVPKQRVGRETAYPSGEYVA